MENEISKSNVTQSIQIPKSDPHKALQQLQNSISEHAPFLKKVFQSRLNEFGSGWSDQFETELNTFFGSDNKRIDLAARGYADFAMDAIKLQKKFNQTREYLHKKYSDLLNSVYLNHNYMFNLYLPGILLSQYLWPHHYRQLRFFLDRFIPLARKEGISLFYDIGVGTGFYSKEMLHALPKVEGSGIDISPHSLHHAEELVNAWGLSSRYSIQLRNIIENPREQKADAILNVEVLEHLEDPQRFLKGIHQSLRNGGLAFITAAVNAPNFDHIYLYRSLNDVAEQISSVGFKIIESVEFVAYEALSGEIAPSSAVFILRKEEV